MSVRFSGEWRCARRQIRSPRWGDLLPERFPGAEAPGNGRGPLRGPDAAPRRAFKSWWSSGSQPMRCGMGRGSERRGRVRFCDLLAPEGPVVVARGADAQRTAPGGGAATVGHPGGVDVWRGRIDSVLQGLLRAHFVRPAGATLDSGRFPGAEAPGNGRGPLRGPEAEAIRRGPEAEAIRGWPRAEAIRRDPAAEAIQRPLG